MRGPTGGARRARPGETRRRASAAGSRASRRTSGGPARPSAGGASTPERGAPTSSAKGTPSPTAILQRTPTVGLLLHVSICERAARLTPDERARSSSESPRAFRRCRRFSATRRPSSAAPTSSPGLARGRLGLRASTIVLHSTETAVWYSETRTEKRGGSSSRPRWPATQRNTGGRAPSPAKVGPLCGRLRHPRLRGTPATRPAPESRGATCSVGMFAAAIAGCRKRDRRGRAHRVHDQPHARARDRRPRLGADRPRARRGGREPYVPRRTAGHRGARGRRHRRGRLRSRTRHLHARASWRRDPARHLGLLLGRSLLRRRGPFGHQGARRPARKDARHRPDRDDAGHRAAQVPEGARLRARRARRRRDGPRAGRRDDPRPRFAEERSTAHGCPSRGPHASSSTPAPYASSTSANSGRAGRFPPRSSSHEATSCGPA